MRTAGRRGLTPMDDRERLTADEICTVNLYMTLATADAEGHPWPSPVCFARASARELVWVSRPDARHSRNIAVRPEVGVVVFDSRAPINQGQAVYLTATAGLVPADDLDRCIATLSRSCQERGGDAWSAADVAPPAGLRLYRAVVAERWLLDSRDRRVPVPFG